jgi:hypothetical protein
VTSLPRKGDVKKMTTVRLRAVLWLTTVACALALLPGAALANCDWYVKTALEQQQRNLKMKCGLSGPEWSAEKAQHADWCASVGPDVSRATAQQREAALGKCRSR